MREPVRDLSRIIARFLFKPEIPPTKYLIVGGKHIDHWDALFFTILVVPLL